MRPLDAEMWQRNQDHVAYLRDIAQEANEMAYEIDKGLAMLVPDEDEPADFIANTLSVLLDELTDLGLEKMVRRG